MVIEKLKKELEKLANSEKAQLLQRFFKTARGEYGEGDVFLGITVPEQRKIARQFQNEASLEDIQGLLNSKIHEYRLMALLILIEKYKKACKKKSEKEKKEIFEFYLENAKKRNINNWDLVDLSAPKIVGDFLLDKNREILHKLANSENLWEKRIAIISCFAFIRENDFKEALEISKTLLNDKHDLIHKAVGWMLREIGKKNLEIEEEFLKENKRYKNMPRTMLRYSIEKFPEEKRKSYLSGNL